MTRHAWIDASAGIAGDMLLGALLDAGADLESVRRCVALVIGDAVSIDVAGVTRAGMRASKAEVSLLVDDPPHRTWASIRTMIGSAGLAPAVRDRALATFGVLAEAEGRVHGVPADDIHFHEVGALDSIADVVGVCAALVDLGVETISVGEVALGSGQVRAAHGTMAVPVPAVVELSRGWRVTAGGQGELTTPTGMALLAALAEASEDLSGLEIQTVGVGAGTKDFPGRANVTRVLLGLRSAEVQLGSAAVVLEANVDDLDPRLWPGVLSRLLAAGADDAWLTPMAMKKGRPAHTLSVLCAPELADGLRAVVFTQTTTFGLRQSSWTKFALPRTWVEVDVLGQVVPVKIAHRGGVIVRATPEFDAVVAAAEALGRPVQDVLGSAAAAAVAAGLAPGAELTMDQSGNRQAWDEASTKHVREHQTMIDDARAGGSLLEREHRVLARILADRPRVVHLQSGNASEDASLIAAGARSVVGVDFSAVAVHAAQRRADQLGLPARYLIGRLPEVPLGGGCCELVYTGKGALNWLPDRDAWAAETARLLTPGGHLFVYEAHPLVPLYGWDPDRAEIRTDRSYFARSHVNDTFPAHGAVEAQHTFAELIMAVLGAGFELLDLVEHPEPFWLPGGENAAVWDGRLPNSFSLLARRRS